MGRLIVYLITNNVNNKKYVGIDSSRTDRRWKDHKKFSKREQPVQLIDQKIKQYGINNFDYNILCECETFEELLEKERHYIKLLNTFCGNGLGYNRSLGGKSGFYGGKMTEEAKQKISGKNHYRYGTHLTEQEKLTRSLTMKGRNAGDNNVFKRPEIRKLLSEIAKKRIGINNTNYKHGNRCGINKPKI